MQKRLVLSSVKSFRNRNQDGYRDAVQSKHLILSLAENWKSTKVCVSVAVVRYMFQITLLLDPRPWPEGSYEIKSVRPFFPPSVHPSVRPSVCPQVFSRLASQFFLNLAWCQGPYIIVCDSRIFLKNPCQAKMTKNSQKWPKNMVFGLFKKIASLVLSEICVK